jgi:glutamate-1-semialdehyde aminotransferase
LPKPLGTLAKVIGTGLALAVVSFMIYAVILPALVGTFWYWIVFGGSFAIAATIAVAAVIAISTEVLYFLRQSRTVSDRLARADEQLRAARRQRADVAAMRPETERIADQLATSVAAAFDALKGSAR